jgi:hypothetical protein
MPVKTWKTTIKCDDFVFANPESSRYLNVSIFMSTIDKTFPPVSAVFFTDGHACIDVKVEPLKEFLALAKKHKQPTIRFTPSERKGIISAPNSNVQLLLQNQCIISGLTEPIDFLVECLEQALTFCTKKQDVLHIAIDDIKRPVNLKRYSAMSFALEDVEVAFVSQRIEK